MCCIKQNKTLKITIIHVGVGLVSAQQNGEKELKQKDVGAGPVSARKN